MNAPGRNVQGSSPRMDAPLVTVLMPVYNAARYVRKAVDSILCQTFADFEFVIINDGSSDATQRILESYSDERIQVLVNDTNRGISATLNLGLARARGKYIARQDADDVSHPARLASQVAFLEANPAIALLGTQARIGTLKFAARRSPLYRALRHDAIRFQALFVNPFVHTSVMYRHSVVWTQLGGYSTDYRICQDYDLWLRVMQHHRVANLDRHLVDLRIHSESISQHPTAQDVQAREELLQANLTWLMPDNKGLEIWPQAWTSATFGPHPLTRDELRQLLQLASLCLQRSLSGKDLQLRGQIRRAYASYLLSAAARQHSHALDACRCALRAVWSSPTITATALAWIIGSTLAGIPWWSRGKHRDEDISQTDAAASTATGLESVAALANLHHHPHEEAEHALPRDFQQQPRRATFVPRVEERLATGGSDSHER